MIAPDSKTLIGFPSVNVSVMHGILPVWIQKPAGQLGRHSIIAILMPTVWVDVKEPLFLQQASAAYCRRAYISLHTF